MGLGGRQAWLSTWDYSYNADSDAWQVYAFTDRPAYRPGQEVQLRGIVREVESGRYANRPRAEYRLEVIDSRGEKLARKFFTKWHEIAHLLTLKDQLEFVFHRTGAAKKPEADQDVYDLVLVDTSLPGLTGNDAAKLLRARITRNPENARIVATSIDHSPSFLTASRNARFMTAARRQLPSSNRMPRSASAGDNGSPSAASRM